MKTSFSSHTTYELKDFLPPETHPRKQKQSFRRFLTEPIERCITNQCSIPETNKDQVDALLREKQLSHALILKLQTDVLQKQTRIQELEHQLKEAKIEAKMEAKMEARMEARREEAKRVPKMQLVHSHMWQTIPKHKQCYEVSVQTEGEVGRKPEGRESSSLSSVKEIFQRIDTMKRTREFGRTTKMEVQRQNEPNKENNHRRANLPILQAMETRVQECQLFAVDEGEVEELVLRLLA